MERLKTVYLGLGTNLGDREANLRYAVDLLGKSICLEKTSSLYDTEPWGFRDQPSFLNCVCKGRTTLYPHALLEAVNDVERIVGREPNLSTGSGQGFNNSSDSAQDKSIRWGPRVMDVDILFYGQQVVHEPGLEIPHPRLAERAFVLVPLAEIAEGYVHPVLKLSVWELLRGLTGDRGTAGSLPDGVGLWASPVYPGGGS